MEGFAYHLRRAPAETSGELGEIAAARCIKSGLDSKPHSNVVLQRQILTQRGWGPLRQTGSPLPLTTRCTVGLPRGARSCRVREQRESSSAW